MLKKLLLILLLTGIVFATTSDNYVPIEYNCDGGTTEFTFDWPIEATSDVEVILKLTSTEDETVLTEDTHYDVSATNNDYTDGGTITTVSTYANTYTLIIRRDTPKTQVSVFEDTRTIRIAAIESGQDKLTRLVQDLYEIIGRCLKIPKTETSDVDLVSISNRADKNITFDATTGDVSVTSVLSTGSASISDWGETFIDDGSAAEARGTLEIDTDDDVEFATIIGTTITGTTGTFDMLITKGPWVDVTHSDYGALGDGITDDSTAFQAAIDACPVGGVVFVPPTTTSYRVANLVIKKPMSLVGVGFGSKLQAVAGETGYLIKIDGAAAGAVTKASLGFHGGAHTFKVTIDNLYLEGNARGASIGGLYINQADWGTYTRLMIFNFAREAINCYSGLRESVFDNIYTKWCGNGTTYPNLNLNDQADAVAESHNNLLFRAFFSNYAIGDHVQMDTLNGKSYNVRKIRFENCMFHGLVPSTDGAGNNPFDMTYSAAQKAFKFFDIGTAEAISITNCTFNTMGLEVPGIDIATGANGDPARIRIVNNEFTGRYDGSSTANDIGIHFQDGELTLIGNTIYGTGGSSITLKTETGSNLTFGANKLSGGDPSIAGGIYYGNTNVAKMDWQDTNFANLKGITIGANNPASTFYADLALNDTGVLNMKETTTPTANGGFGKLYTKDDNKLYFQDGAGNEYEITMTGP